MMRGWTLRTGPAPVETAGAQTPLAPGERRVLRITVERPATPELSGRQRQTLRLTAAGLGEREIAAALGVSRETVKCYRRQLRALCGARNAAHLVDRAHRLGLLGPGRRS